MTRKRRVAEGGSPPAGRSLWAYGYEMVPLHMEDRMAEIRALLDRQNVEAARTGRTWTARLVSRRVINVLIVSTDPGQDVDINRRLEADLTELGLQYLPTAPMRVTDETGPDDSAAR